MIAIYIYSYPNLSRDEWEALHSSMNDDKIVIKPADEESNTTVWSKKDYLMEDSKSFRG